MQSKFEAARRWRTPITLVSVGLIGGTLLMPSVSPATHVIKAAQDVFVANTPSHPIPTKAIGVEGVRVENGDDKPVPVTGAVDANIQGTPTVRVAADPQTPITRRLYFNGAPDDDPINAGQFFQRAEAEKYVVPEGKRLTIHYVALQLSSSKPVGGWWFRFDVRNSDWTAAGSFPFHMSETELSLNEQTTIVAKAGQEVRFEAGHDGSRDIEWDVSGAFTGTLTDVDTGDGSTG